MEKVYFTKVIEPESIIKLYDMVGKKLPGKIAVKVHSGEDGNQNFIGPEFIKPIVDYVGGRVVECNCAYKGMRTNAKDHEKLLEKHGWSKYFDVDIMDRDGSLKLDIPNGKVIKENYVGKNIENYDSMLVIAHGKGHPMGGYGCELKQLSIGCASKEGKAYIHSAGKTRSATLTWLRLPKQKLFLESMADAASSVVNYFKGNIVYIAILKNIGVDCDCVSKAEDPCMADIGILAGTDPVAIDKAFLDLVENSNDEGKAHFLERVNSREGKHTIEAAVDLGIGTTEYELIDIDK